MSDLITTGAVIDALNGTGAVSRLCGRSPQAVSNWRRDDRAKFPAETFVVMQAALAAIGKSAPAQLWGMDQPSSRPTPSEAA